VAKILLIDDDPDVTEAGRLVLEQAGHSVTTAGSAAEGAAAVARALPDLVVLDIMMAEPDDGIVLARQWRRQGYRFPIIALSSIGAVTGNDYGQDEQILPVNAFIAKPASPSALVAQVEQLLAVAGE